MQSKHVWIYAGRMLAMGAATSLLITAAWAASATKLVYSFGGNADGEYTDTELVRDSAGNLYGTSVQGGIFGGGTVFQVTPAGVHTVLYDFTGGADGGEPYKGVTLDAQGNLYGTAVTGGGGSCEGGCGVVYKLSNSGGSWNQTVIHTFTGSDGSGPGSPVAIDKNGDVFGTTPTGGANGIGVVYQLREDAGAWKFRVIHTFTGGDDGGGGSASRLLIDAAGNLFGVCTVGGANGFGTVFEMSQHQGQWQLTTLYAFKDSPDGALAVRRVGCRQGPGISTVPPTMPAPVTWERYTNSRRSTACGPSGCCIAFKEARTEVVRSAHWSRMQRAIFTALRVKVGLRPADAARFSKCPATLAGSGQRRWPTVFLEHLSRALPTTDWSLIRREFSTVRPFTVAAAMTARSTNLGRERSA